MIENNFKPNSHKSKEEQKLPEKRVEKVITGNVKVKKKNDIRKLADVFISEDVTNVKSYVLTDVIVPAIKKAIVDVVSDGVHMLFYGGARRNKDSRVDKISYVDYSKRNNYDDRRASTNDLRTSYSSDQFTFETRGEAEEVLAQMDGIVEKYGMVRVLDLYDMVGKTCDHTANKYGWTSTRNATVERVRDGYVIKMPRALPID
jgi:hypothetical protein